MTRSTPAEAGAEEVGQTSTHSTVPVRQDRLLLHSIDLEVDLPGWFDDLQARPSKSVLDAWRWAFRRHGSRTLTATQKDVVWTLHTYARATDSEDVLAGTAWPAQQTLADDVDVSVQTVGEAMKAAEAAGWITRRRNPNKTSTVFLSIPKVLPVATRKRSRRSVPTENRTPVVTENHLRHDGEPDFRHDGDEPEGNPNPTCESEVPGPIVEPSPTRVPDAVKIRFTSGASEGTERDVTNAQAATAVRRGIAELVTGAA